MAFYERDEKGALVPISGGVPEEAIRAFEVADEETIVHSLTQVEAQPFFAYSYPIKTKEGVKDIIGISVDGAKEIARELGNIRASPDVKVQEKDDYFYGIVPVTDLVRNITLLGFARQAKYIIGEGMIPTDRIDETSYVKALSKAQRNGILSVAPQRMIADIISKLDTRAIKRLSGPLTPNKPSASTKAKESPDETEIKSLRQQLHLKWEEFQKLNPDIGDKKKWLREQYGAESSIELSLYQIREAVAKVNAMLEEKTGPLATTEEKREIVKALRELGKNDKEIQSFFHDTTGKKGGYTKADVDTMLAKIGELKPKAEEAEAEDFLKQLEG